MLSEEKCFQTLNLGVANSSHLMIDGEIGEEFMR